MAREDLRKLLQVVQQLAHDPEERVAFTGRSIADISKFLEQEMEEHPELKEKQFVAAWAKNVRNFRAQLLESARSGQSIVTINGRSAPLIRETDTASATSKSHKGPNYPYPDEW